jgi:hypothetical protein
MRKQILFVIVDHLRSLIRKQDTHYKMSTLTEVRMACAFDKLAQGCNLLICSALFVVGQLTISLVFREVIITFNVVFKNPITWPFGNKMEMVMQVGFKTLCGPPSIQGAIDDTHFSISKPNRTLCEYYFYHKTTRYNVVCQAIVNDQKQFTNIFVGLPGSVNDYKVLRRFKIYYFVQSQELLNKFILLFC